MNCELAHERIVAAAYGELADAQVHELDRHLENCAPCRREREELHALKVLADAYPVLEPDANLIARSRRRLDEALDDLPQQSRLERLRRRIFASFAGLGAAPLSVGLVLLLGAAAGGGAVGYGIAINRSAHSIDSEAISAPPQSEDGVEVTDVSSIQRRPNSEIVEVRYNQLVPRRLEGSLDDPAIRQLLMLASQGEAPPGVRDDSVELMAAECRAGHSCKPSGIRDALMIALRYDRSEGVREKALKGLEPYVAEDVRVRDAILEALLYDSDARIRTAAINILEPVEADTSVRQVLHTVATSDENPHIRTVSREVLSRMPEIQ